MASISADADELLSYCLADLPWPPSLLDRLITPEGSPFLFRVVVERLADLFEPRLCQTYARLFAEVIERSAPELDAAMLLERYARVRLPRTFTGDAARVKKVFVLSRVTLGADVAVTSVALDAAKRKFPNAEIHFVGPVKNWELFCADPRLRHLSLEYGRLATLGDRLGIWPGLRTSLTSPDSVVIDPDSRLTQLGLLPVCPEANYYFFESRSFGGDGAASLGSLTAEWLERTFGIAGARAYIQPNVSAASSSSGIAVSLGVGGNDAKRIPDPFERDLIRWLSQEFASVIVDRGFGGEEAARVDRAIAGLSPTKVRPMEGSFAQFAAAIAGSRLYIGYDSAGGHVAAACGVPLVSIAAGFVSERMRCRWVPTGTAPVRQIFPSGMQSTLHDLRIETAQLASELRA